MPKPAPKVPDPPVTVDDAGRLTLTSGTVQLDSLGTFALADRLIRAAVHSAAREGCEAAKRKVAR
jgi:hypothetical protein